MNDSRILYEAFNIYYANGMKALEENRLDSMNEEVLAVAVLLVARNRSSLAPLTRICR